MTSPSLAEQLIDAQVAYVLDQLTGDALTANIAEVVDDLLGQGARITVAELVDREAVKPIVRRALLTAPASTGAAELVDAATDVVYAGPAVPFTAGELVVREQVEALIDELLGMSAIVERSLERLTDSPLVGTVASRFMGRIVGEVLQANRAVAGKVPGLGSLMDFGTSAASKVIGAADKQFESLIGDTAGKSAQFAVRRLNRIIVETLRDPTTRDAVLQVWDLLAEEPVVGLDRYAEREEVGRLVEAVHGLVATAAGTEHLAALADSMVDAFFGKYGEHPVTTLLDELEVGRDDLVADLTVLVPRIVESARAEGELERLVRSRVEPFFRSPAVAAILG